MSQKARIHSFGHWIGNHVSSCDPSQTSAGAIHVIFENGEIDGSSLVLHLRESADQLVDAIIEGPGVHDGDVGNAGEFLFPLVVLHVVSHELQKKKTMPVNLTYAINQCLAFGAESIDGFSL